MEIFNLLFDSILFLQCLLFQLPSPSFMKTTLETLKLGTRDNICTIDQTCPVHKALLYFIERRVSALPVVDSDGKLVDIYAKFDVINLAATRTYENLDITVGEALNFRKGKFKGVATCEWKDTLETIIDSIVNAGVHRLVVVDESHKIVGIVSLSDILSFLITGSNTNCT